MQPLKFRLVFLFIVLVLSRPNLLSEPDDSQALVTGEGFSLARSEVEKAAALKMKELDMEALRAPARIKKRRHEILSEVMEKMVSEKLLSMESEKRGITVEELTELEITTRNKPLTEGELDKLFDLNKNRLQGTKEEKLAQITAYLNTQRKNEAHREYTKKLARDYGVEYQLPPVRFNIATAGHPAFGPEDAQVTIIEFSDFECPHCSQAPSQLHRVYEEFDGKVRIVFRQYPLTLIHKKSWKAAEASLCAAEQGKFWGMHNLLFSGQDKLEVKDLKEKAVQLELDQASFNECLDSNKYSEAVNLDLIEGSKAGITGTPALFINGRPFEGRLTYENIRQMVLEELPQENTSE